MTRQELVQHFELRKQLSRDEELLASMRAATAPHAQTFSGMPRSPGARDRVGDLAVEIADLERQIAARKSEIAQAETSIAAFIASIKDAQLRIIFRLRFLHGLTWAEVAEYIGGRNTAGGIKARCYRYLDAQARKEQAGECRR